MKDKYLQQLKSLENEEEKLKAKIIELLIAKKISVDDLISARKKKHLAIPDACFYSIGLSYSQGKNELKKNTILAFQLYKYAADVLNYAAAYRNCAYYYYDGRAPDGEDLEQAENYCKKAEVNKQNVNLLMAEIYYKQGKYTKAVDKLKKILASKEDEEKTDAQELIKNCFIAQLNTLYVKLKENSPAAADDSETGVTTKKLKKASLSSDKKSAFKDDDPDEEALPEQVEAVAKANKPLFPGWSRISDFLDGFDVTSCSELAVQLELISLQLQIAKKASEVASERLKNLKKQNTPPLIIRALEAEEKKLDEKFEELEAKEEKIRSAYEKYMNINKKIITRQIQTERRFFDPRRTKKPETHKFAEGLISNLTHPAETAAEPRILTATNQPARRLITAERSTIETAKMAYSPRPDGYGYIDSIGWEIDPKETETYQSKYKLNEQFFTVNSIKIENTTISYKQKVNPHKNHLGDCKVKGAGNYKEILSELNKLTNSNEQKEKELAVLMLDFCKGVPVTLDKVKKINAGADANTIDKLNKIFYLCFVKEPARWMQPFDENFELPSAIAQARAVKLIAAGYLKIVEVFGVDAPYGVFTGSNIGEDRSLLNNKIIRINNLYNKTMLEHDPETFPKYLEFFKTHPKGEILPTRNQLHQELKEVYGGDSDTDGEGYESDDEKEKLCNAIKANN